MRRSSSNKGSMSFAFSYRADTITARGERLTAPLHDHGFPAFGAAISAGTGPENLTILAAIPENRDTFAPSLKRELIGIGNGVGTHRVQKIDGLADGRVRVELKGCLHSNVPFGRNLVSCSEEFRK